MDHINTNFYIKDHDNEFSTELIAIINNNIPQSISISDSITIYMSFIDKNRAIKGLSSNINKIDNVDTIDSDSIRFVEIKLIKFKNLM